MVQIRDNERELWETAMVKELKYLKDLGSFKMLKHPRGANILKSTWAFKKKHYPDGNLRKYKAHLCVRGNQKIEGIDFVETYAPIVSWITVCLLLVLSLIFNLATQQVNYTNEFCQASLE